MIFVIVLALLAVLILRGYARRGLISRSLNLELLLVRFSPVAPSPQEPTMQQIREKIALMEQFYSHLHLIRDNWWRKLLYGKPTFSLELTIPSIGEEISFYVAVPRRLRMAVEKVIQGIFPDAQVEVSRDYNIFNPEGQAVGAGIVLKENRYYPLKTYQKLEGDPMKELTNVFTKLAKEGEGAALQIIARPARKKWSRKLKDRAKILFGGKKAKESVLLGAVRGAGDFTGMTPGGPAQERPEELKKITPLQEEIVRALENKASKPLFDANIRILASAVDDARARSILQGLTLAFAQFADQNLNSFKIIPMEGRSLKSFIFNFSFRGFDDYRKIILGSEELTSIFHFPNILTETPKLKIVKAREAPPPVNVPQDGLLLGYNVFRGEKTDIKLSEEDRRRHLYIIGQTGTGKSVFLESMIIQDIQAGKGVCVIDPHGDMVERILGFVPRHRAQDVVYFNPGDVARPMGLNMLEYDPNFPEQKTFIVNELLSIFDKLYNMSIAGGPMFEQYFRNSTLLVMDDPTSGNTLIEIERVLTDKPFRDLKLSRSNNIVVKNFWTQIAEKAGGEASLKDMVPYIASKFDNFIANEIMRPIIAQEKSAFNFREVMDNQKILLVNLSKGRLGDLNSSLIGLVIVGKLLMAALSRTDQPEERRKDFYLYIDEFQNVTTDSIATILSEARKYRLDLIITHQFIGQLKEEIKKAVFGNVGSMVSFRIGSDDGEFMAKQYKPVFSEQDLLNIDNFNCYVKLLIKGQTSPSFSMKTYPSGKGEKEVAEMIKEISRTKYGRPREEVEREIMEKHQKPSF
ncbi:MAG: type IV secretion system DNA-binding domain-containing protein [Candidatus Sungbacteria bacterium]|nr:type IV secretion system DNA-binding domain-containing protein [Candidatus Sungbacteria bacterium]